MSGPPVDGVVIREATASDALAIGDFLRSAWQEAGPNAPGFAGATDDLIAEMAAADAVRARIGGPERRTYLAWHDAEIVGFAATREVDRAVVELAGIVVRRPFTGRGIGSLLMEVVVARAADTGYKTLVVRTEVTTSLARAFSEGMGFGDPAADVERVGDRAVGVWELTRRLA